LDLHIPGFDGGRLLREIRKGAGIEKANVIIVPADAAFPNNLRPQADPVLLKR
jgi:hypothetical protein